MTDYSTKNKMPRTKIQNEQIRVQKRMQIINSALEIFAQKGYHTTTIADIAKHAGIAKGLMYNYFTSKEELLHSILIEGYELITENFDPNHDGILEPHEMLLFINDLFGKLDNDRDYWRLYFSVTLQPGVIDDYFHKEMLKKYKPLFDMIIKYFEAKGVEDPYLEMVFAHSLIDGVFINFLYDKDYPLDKIKQLVIKRLV